MAISDKNIVITPNISGTFGEDPKIVFTGADSSIGDSAEITLSAISDNNGTLSFTGSQGQLFSITNSFTGTIFSVNDISGVPSLEVDDQGIVKLARFNGKVTVATTDSGSVDSDVLNVGGNVLVRGGHHSSPFATFLLDSDTYLGSSGIVGSPSASGFIQATFDTISAQSADADIFDSSDGEINFNVAGHYMFAIDISSIMVAGSGRGDTEAKLQIATTKDGSFSDVTGTLTYQYNRTAGKGENTSSINLIKHIDAGNKFRVVARHFNNTTSYTKLDADGCRFTVYKL